MATPQNRLIQFTRQSVQNLGVDIEDLVQILTIQVNEDDKMAEAALKMLTKLFNALTIKIDNFDGTGNIQNF